MVRAAFRAVALLALAGGFSVGVIDAVRSIFLGRLALTSLGAALAPAGLNPPIGAIAGAPLVLVLVLAGLAALRLGRAPKPEIGFSSRDR